MRVAVSALGGEPRSPRVWSGIPAQLLTAADELGYDFVSAGELRRNVHRLAKRTSAVTARLGRTVVWETEPAVTGAFSRALRGRLDDLGADVVFAAGWYPRAELLGGRPLVIWIDATRAQRVDRAPHWSQLSGRTRRLLERVEADAYRSAAAMVFTTHWAADDARARYGLADDKVHVVPFGASLAADPGPIARRPHETIRILLIAVNWRRKGVDRAVLAVDALTRRGCDVHLDVVGVQPPDATWERPNVKYHGFLPKSSPEFDELFRGATMLALPSRSEPYAMVLSEAAAYSLPIIATRIDGITERYADGAAGLLVGDGDDIEEWADVVQRIVEDADAYLEMCAAARRFFDTGLSWASSAEALHDVCLGVHASGERLGSRAHE